MASNPALRRELAINSPIILISDKQMPTNHMTSAVEENGMPGPASDRALMPINIRLSMM